jgi:hypothetical protein
MPLSVALHTATFYRNTNPTHGVLFTNVNSEAGLMGDRLRVARQTSTVS